MAYDHPGASGEEYYVSYPVFYMQYKDNEKLFKGFLNAYLAINEPTSKAVGVTSDLRFVCKPNPELTVKMVAANHAARKAPAKPKAKGGRKK